jgi:hypothetical protein
MLILIIFLLMIIIPVPVMLRHMLNGGMRTGGLLEGFLSAMTVAAAFFLIYWSLTGVTFFDTTIPN